MGTFGVSGRCLHFVVFCVPDAWYDLVPSLVLPGTIVNRTYGIHKNLYVYTLLLTIFGPVNYGPP